MARTQIIDVGSLVHCSLLAEDAIKAAIKNYHSKRAAATNLAGTPTSTLADVAAPTQAAAAAEH